MLTVFSAALAGSVVLSDEVTAIEAAVAGLTAESCAADLQGVFDRLRPLTPTDVEPADLAATGDQLTARLWATRGQLQARLGELHAAGTLTDDCLTGARRFGLSTRYLVDHLYMAGFSERPWLTTPGFTGSDDLRSGDILVSRGDALSSAGIAHIGRIDSQFSHNAMVYIDPDGAKWTVEAYLERGALVQPLETFLNHGQGRIAVLRFEDPEVAARGAKMTHDRIVHGPAIAYDEKFDSSSPDELFCSEIGPWALRIAGGPTDVPLQPSRFPKEDNPRMFEAMGIEGDLVAAPVDLLYDPRFTLIGEWREVEALERMRRQDAVVEALFTWMERDGYALDPRWANKATVDVGLTVRRIPGVGNLLAAMVHPKGDRRFLVAGLALQEAGEAVYGALLEALEGREGYVSYDELHTLLEQIRADDLARWEKRPRKSDFHRVLHP